jgi:hypothetical protein
MPTLHTLYSSPEKHLQTLHTLRRGMTINICGLKLTMLSVCVCLCVQVFVIALFNPQQIKSLNLNIYLKTSNFGLQALTCPPD